VATKQNKQNSPLIRLGLRTQRKKERKKSWPLAGDLIGSTINYIMLWYTGPGQVLGSYVANQVIVIRLVQ